MAGFVGLNEPFAGHHFDGEVIVLCVRGYLRFKLSFRPLVEKKAERGPPMVYTTIMHWMHHQSDNELKSPRFSAISQ